MDRLPSWITRWVGYRAGAGQPPPTYALYVWPFLGSFSALALLQAVFAHSGEYFPSRGVPAIVTSYGASAVLCFDKVESPFAQPRSLFGGHFLSGLVGVIMAKIFWTASGIDYEDAHPLVWLAASLSTAIAIFVMQITKTTHPPAGATALLPLLDTTVHRLGWYLLPVLLLSSALTMCVAMLINNIQRRYPVFWWEPSKPAPQQADPKEKEPSKLPDTAPNSRQDHDGPGRGFSASDSSRSVAGRGAVNDSPV